jgi:hypothetical protein
MEINTFDELQAALLIAPKNEVFKNVLLNLGFKNCLTVIIHDLIISSLKDNILIALKRRKDINLITYNQYGRYHIIIDQIKSIDVDNILSITRAYGGIKLDFNEATGVFWIG